MKGEREAIFFRSFNISTLHGCDFYYNILFICVCMLEKKICSIIKFIVLLMKDFLIQLHRNTSNPYHTQPIYFTHAVHAKTETVRTNRKNLVDNYQGLYATD